MQIGAEIVESEGSKEVNYKGCCLIVRADYSHVQKCMCLVFSDKIVTKPF
jgi:hypothetical protein